MYSHAIITELKNVTLTSNRRDKYSSLHLMYTLDTHSLHVVK